MEKPDVDLKTLSFGKIFQIDPIGKEPIQVQFGGDFLISVSYEKDHVLGYIANVHEMQNLTRYKGIAFVKVPWKLLECVGSVNWFKKLEEEGGEKGNSQNDQIGAKASDTDVSV